MNTEIFSPGELYSLLCALCWAVAVIFFRKCGRDVTPLALNFFKDVTAAALFLISMLILGVPFLPEGTPPSDFLILLVSGIVGVGLSDTLFLASLNRLGAALASVVECLYCPFVVLAAFLYLGEDIGWSLLISTGLMTAAILVASQGGGHNAEGQAPVSRAELAKGVTYGLLSMLGMAAGIVLAKPVLNHSNVWWATFVRLAGAVLFLGLLGFRRKTFAEYVVAFTPGRHWRNLVPASIIATYLGMVLWIAGMKYTQASVASVLNQASAIFIPLLAAVFLKERLTVAKGVAAVLGFAGVVWITIF